MIFNKKIKRIFFILIFIFAIIGSVIFIGRVFSYDSNNAHPYLTEKAVELFIQNSEIEISQQQLEWIKQGAIEEDTIPRWMNHFYDPITGKGLEVFASSKVWAQSPNLQKIYFLFKGDQTWQKAIDSYAKGNKKEAFIALGHILHLIEDMSVPAHTRNDAHPEGDPYESWVKNNADKDFDEIFITKFNNLDNFFDLLASYSNKYFLSKGTINKNELALMDHFFRKINDTESIECIKQNLDNQDICLITVRRKLLGEDYFLDVPIVHSDYYSLLAPKVISYGAGVIDLFFKEAEIKKQTQTEKSFFEKLLGSVAGILGNSDQSFPSPSLLPLEPKSVFGSGATPIPTPTFYPESVEGPTPTPSPIRPISQITPTPQPTPILAPQPSPTPSLGLLPYPGFGGGVPAAPLTSDVFSSTSDVAAPTPEPSPTPTPTFYPEPVEGPTPTPTPTPDPQPLDVVINEIAWAGTSQQTSQDEWIELYNNTDYDIDFNDGWILYSETDLKPYIELSGIIPAKGFYLIERTDNNTISDIDADLTSSFGNGLNNNGEALILSHASTTIDQTVLCNGGKSQWPPCGDYSYKTMERVDSEIAGTDYANWNYNNSLIMNGKDAKGGNILGTPKARNSVSYLIANRQSEITENIFLKKSKSPYIVHNQIQEFKDDAVLTIEPGVVIKFSNDAGLNFSGNAKIISHGTADDPIIFTSFSDDEYGGDLNNDATSSAPYPGGWFGVKIETSNNDSVFDNNIFRYGGKYYNGQNQSLANLAITGVSADIQNSIFENSKIYGLKLVNSNSNVLNNIFRNNNDSNDPAGSNAGLVILCGTPAVQNNQFINNARGLYLSYVQGDIQTNDFQSNRNEAVYSFGLMGSFSGNSGAGNGSDNIILNGHLTQAGSNTFVYPNDLPYFLWGGEEPKVAASSTLEIGPGVVFKFSKVNHTGQLEIYGNFIVSGTGPDSVIFTSIYDGLDGVEADMGQWNGIFMKPGSYSDIRGASFKYANIALIYQNSPVNLSNVKFFQNNLGIYADPDSIIETAESIEFLDNVSTTTPAGLW